MRAVACLLLFTLAVGCSRSRRTSESTTLSAETSATPAPPQVDRADLEKEGTAKATKTWLAFNKTWQSVDAIVRAKVAPKPCTKAAPASTTNGLSIAADSVTELAKPSATHSIHFDGDAMTSSSIVETFRLPFVESERRSARDYDPAKAATKLAALEAALYPLVVLRIDDFVAPELIGEKTFRPGRAASTAFFFESAASVCSFKLATASPKTISALSFGGQTGGRDALNARFANELRQTVQRDAGTKLVALGRLGALEPVVPGKRD